MKVEYQTGKVSLAVKSPNVHCDVTDAVTKESSQIFTHSTFLEYTIQLFQNDYHHHITVIILQGNYTLIL